MKTTPKAIQLSGSTLQKVSAAIIGCLMILSLPSCQENTPLSEEELLPSYSGQTSLKGETFIKELRVFYGPETFTSGKAQPVTEMCSLTAGASALPDGTSPLLQNGRHWQRS